MITPEQAMAELLRRKAQTDLLAFMSYCWWMPTPLRIGRHTLATCARLTKAVDDYLKHGKMTYLLINMPFRHGKSDMVSRALPAYFLGRCAEKQPNVIMSGYGASLIEGFSSKVQEIVRSEAYRKVFPKTTIAGKASSAEWTVKDSQSTTYAMGLGGAITGKGGNLIIVDDYCKNREEAESKAIRDKMWNSFKDDLSTRFNAGGGLMVVCATRWHGDDISGRIKQRMLEDPDYPRYEELVFPAKKEPSDIDPNGWDILFPELYDEKWYRTQRTQLGPYSAAALLDCNPVTSETAAFKEEWIADCVYDKPPNRDTMNVYIVVDGANSKRKDSDYTTMLVIGLGQDQNYYLLDLVHDHLDLNERTKEIIRLHRKWRPISVFWEQVGCMSDVAHIKYVQNHTENYRFPIIAVSRGPKDNKRTRILNLQAPFSQRRIWLPKYGEILRQQSDGRIHDLIKDFIDDEYLTYPNSKHDDMLDPLADILDKKVAELMAWPETQESQDEGDYAMDNEIFAR